jgi:hypothetical protein
MKTPKFEIQESDFEDVSPRFEVERDGEDRYIVRFGPYEAVFGLEDVNICFKWFNGDVRIGDIADVHCEGSVCMEGPRECDVVRMEVKSAVSKKTGLLALGFLRAALEEVMRMGVDIHSIRGRTHEKFARFLSEMGYRIDPVKGVALFDVSKDLSRTPPRLPNIWRQHEELVG